jgi:histidinol-phosphate aminotransferase
VAGRAAAVAGERARLAAAAREAGLDVVPSQANVLWIAAPGVGGAELARRLERVGVVVAPGGALGDPARVRLTVPPARDAADRALRALENAGAPGPTRAGASRHPATGSPPP